MSAFLTQVVLREWLLTPVVILLLVAPGLGFAAVAARRIRLSWPEILVAGFALTVAFTSAVATACWLADRSLNVVLGVYLALIPVSLALLAAEWRSGRLARHAAERGALVLAGIAALVAMLERPWFTAGADTFYHLAATRSLLVTGRPLVTDPFFGTPSRALDPTSGVLHTMQAILSRTLATDIATLYLGITAFAAALAVLAFWVLARRVGGSARAATLATIAMAAVAYHFDFRVLAYPKHVSEALAFFGIALLVRLLEEPAWPVVVLAALVGAATVTMHLAAAEFLFLAGGFVALALAAGVVVDGVRGISAEERRWARPLLAVIAALGLTAALSVPVLLSRLGALSGSSVLGADSYLQLGGQVMRIAGIDLVKPGGMYVGGPLVFFPLLVLIAFALPPAYRDRDQRALAAVALTAMIPLVLTDPLVTPFALHYSSYMVARMAALMRFMPFVGVAWALGAVLPSRPALMPKLAAGLIALAVLGAAPDLVATASGWRAPGFERGLDVYGLGATLSHDLRAEWGVAALAKMRETFGDRYPVVAADELTGYYFAGLEPVALVGAQAAHSPSSIETHDGRTRRAAIAALLAPATSREERLAILGRYRVDYVLIDRQVTPRDAELSLAREPGLFRPVVTSDRLVLFKVVAHLWSGS
jgi:hypothetical protein